MNDKVIEYGYEVNDEENNLQFNNIPNNNNTNVNNINNNINQLEPIINSKK